MTHAPGADAIDLAAELARTRGRIAELEAELSIVNEVGQALARQLDFESIMEAVGERASEALGAAGLSIALQEPETGTVRFLYWLDHGVRHREMEGKVLGDELTARILATGRPIRVSTADEAAAIGAPFKVSDTESYVGVPIPASDRTIGVIAIGTSQRHAYSEDDERLLSTLATNMGVALANARLFEETKRLLAETRRQKQYFEALVDISPVAIMIMDRSQIVSGWNPAATRLLGYEPNEAIGRHVDDLVFRAEDRAKGQETTRLADETGRAQLISRRRRKDGELVDVESLHGPARRGRRAPGLLRDLPRHHRAPGGAAGGRRGEPGQERVPGRDEPRDPDADECGHRHERAAARHAARRRAARLRARRSGPPATRC